MEKIYSLLIALLISQNVLAIDKTWTGAINTHWADPSNWSPVGVPTAADAVLIPNVFNKPVVNNGTKAFCTHIIIQDSSALTISDKGTLKIQNTPKFRKVGVNVQRNSILTNNGTLNIFTINNNTNGMYIYASGIVINTGILDINTAGHNINILEGKGTFTNTVSGVVNFENGRGINCLSGYSGSVITNQGIMNYSANDFFLSLENGNSFNNSGIINITKGYGVSVGGGIMNNQACGKILMPNCDYMNSAAGSYTTNAGLLESNALMSTSGSFSNIGVLKYNSMTGIVNTIGNGVAITNNNSAPLYCSGNAIKGIYRDSNAVTLAGTFSAPNKFLPSEIMPQNAPTLYVKICPSNGECSYVIPFTYNSIDVSGAFIKPLDVVEAQLNQNYPNPFIYETKISFTINETQKTNLTIYDITGREVFTLNKGFKIGYNEVILDKSSFQREGIYFYRLTSGKYTAVKRLEFFGE